MHNRHSESEEFSEGYLRCTNGLLLPNRSASPYRNCVLFKYLDYQRGYRQALYDIVTSPTPYQVYFVAINAAMLRCSA